jgi:pyrroloquinoline quinone biosynthesis protein E
MLINPSGKVLPCHAAEVLPGLSFENVRENSLQWIWQESPSFKRFRGEDWMPEPCRGCDRRTEDFGGCRCQAFLLAGDATVTDPACSLAPSHGIVESAVLAANSDAAVAVAKTATSFVQLQKQNTDLWVYRTNPE